MDKKGLIESGKTSLGIEFGSTRIKAQLTTYEGKVLASGDYTWKNKLVGGIWTYALEDIHKGLKACYKSLAEDVKNTYGVSLKKIGAIGVSAMMHGYMAFDKNDRLFVPFRTWRNSITGRAADELTEVFGFNIPQRWSIAHLYQAILDNEEHVGDIAFITTLAGYIHFKLTGKKVIGIGDGSGMFPIDSEINGYDRGMLKKFSELIAGRGFSWKTEEILPKVLLAGEDAGSLTEEGAAFLDESGELQAGVPLCPPEGDAGTGMAATNSIAVRTGNVSAGTSVFSMVVLEKALKKVHREIDMVTTPTGRPVAMVHVNNCTSDINAWAKLFYEFGELMGLEISKNQLYDALFEAARKGAKDGGGLLSYGYLSGENITGCDEGRPMFIRKPDADFTLGTFMRTHLYSAVAALKIGMDILTKEEGVKVDLLLGHGGFFKTKEVGQSVMADAMEVPIACMETAGEGGPWGMALLAAYAVNKDEGETLEHYLNEKVFADSGISLMEPVSEDVEGFKAYVENYKAVIGAEKTAIDTFL
ncbi:MAG: FGGY-family carbohydrate kinase [Clostridiales bacterium]|nr:FGGY-family carbohydrate kinase [Clostridiales bacterium]